SGSEVPQTHLDVAGEGMPEIMEPEAGDPTLPDRRLPSLFDAHVACLGLMVPEHIIRAQVPRKMPEDFQERVIDRDAPILASLGLGEMDEPLLQVYPIPGEPEDLSPPHSRVKRTGHDGQQMTRAD